VGILSPEHLVPLALLVVVAVPLCVAARRAPGRWTAAVAAIIAITLVIAELSWQPYVVANHTWSAAASLPVQLCDVGGFVAAAALVWRQLLLVEVAYFWGLGGTLQAVLTPDLQDHHFPSFPYLQFYVTHDLVILAALFLVIGLALRPRPGAVRRIYLLTLGFAAVIGLIDLVTGGNYMYLRVRAPGSLLEVMGPWPWYIATGALLTLVVLAILYAPFRLSRLCGHDAG
jgi:hypothetical integral membrane protein (TIGR02206 family)